MTVEQLILGAMRLATAIDPGEGPSTTELNDAHERLNLITEAWNAEPDAIVTKSVYGFSAASGNHVLPIRPLLILSASCSANGFTMPVEVCSPERWAAAVLERQTQAIMAKALFCDYGYPGSTVLTAPLSPTGVIQIVQLIPGFVAYPNLTDTVTLAPGYLKALQYQLAVELAPEFGCAIPPSVAAIASEAKGALGTLNMATRGAAAAAPVTDQK